MNKIVVVRRRKKEIGCFHEKEIHQILIDSDVEISNISVRYEDLFFWEADLSLEEVEIIASDILCNTTVDEYEIYIDSLPEAGKDEIFVDIGWLAGVMDPWSLTLRRAIRERFLKDPQGVWTAKRYRFSNLDMPVVEKIVPKLYNPLVQVAKINNPYNPFNFHPPYYSFKKVEIDIIGKDEDYLMELSRKMQLSLSCDEMVYIRDYYQKLGRNPTDVELETIAQTWSEHCQHKTFKTKIKYKEIDKEGNIKKEEVINSLFKDYIVRATQEAGSKICLSVFEDNAGIVEFDDKWAVCFKVETHNHPSALEPFGGANTGIGGVIRDILGAGLGAKPIANTDVFCFAPPDMQNIPSGIIPPKEIMKGVVAGVRDYGNKMGIPTVSGAIFFDERFFANPLVFCGTVGLIPKDVIEKKACPGDKIVLIGGRTGRDGIHGATFSSAELEDTKSCQYGTVVQIGNPIEEKKFADVLLKIRDKKWYTAITDCGAGGLSSAVGEMAKDCGAVVYLDKVPLKYSGLSYAEIWISESQERMVLAVKPEYLDELIAEFSKEDVLAVCIGEFTGDKRLRLFYQDNLVMDMDVEFLHTVPLREKEAVWVRKDFNIVSRRKIDAIRGEKRKDVFLKVLSDYNVACKEWVIRQYDHEVQGKTVVKPLSGPHGVAPMDAAVIRPHLYGKKAVAISCGINPRYGEIDPYWMACCCIDEAVRQIVSVGGDWKRIALLDNFCWGNPDKPDRLGSLVRAVKGCYEFASKLSLPFISGKDSLYNEYMIEGKSYPILGTVLISAIGIVEDLGKVVTSDLKEEESLIYIVGLTKDELAGGIFAAQMGINQLTNVPKPDPMVSKELYSRMYQAIKEGLIVSCHDVSDGGIGVCAAEMCIGSNIGMELFLNNVPFDGDNRVEDVIFYSESPTRWIVEVRKSHKGRFEKVFDGLAVELIGKTTAKKRFEVFDLEGEEYVCVDISLLRKVWRSRFRW